MVAVPVPLHPCFTSARKVCLNGIGNGWIEIERGTLSAQTPAALFDQVRRIEPAEEPTLADLLRFYECNCRSSPAVFGG